MLLGFTPPDEQAHAPNEWMDLANYETGIRTIVRTWDELADCRSRAVAMSPCADLVGPGG